MATEARINLNIKNLVKDMQKESGVAIAVDSKKLAAEVAAGTKTMQDVERELQQKQQDRIDQSARMDALRLEGRERIAAARARQAAAAPYSAQAQAALQKAQQRVAELSGGSVVAPPAPVIEPPVGITGGQGFLTGPAGAGQVGAGQGVTDRATAEALVRDTFASVLGRQPLQGGLDFWTNQLMTGVANPSDLAIRVAQGATGIDTAPAQRFLQSQGLTNAAVVPDRATSENLVRNAYQTIFGRQPLQEGLDFWTNQLMTGVANPDDLFTRVAEGAQGTDVAAAQRFLQSQLGQGGPTLTSDPLAITGETNIDPTIAPYLQEALGVARNLFLTGPGPQLFPGQMYVSPSEQTLQALQQAEQLVTSPEAQALSTQGLQAYQGALGGLSSMARGDYLQSPEYQRYLESVTRPVTEQLTQQILPSIASQYSAAGRYGSGAMQQATGKATELGTRALGDITAQVAQQQQGRMLEAQTSLPSFLGAMPSVLQGSLAPSTALAGIGAQREAVAAQPLQEAITRFEYGQQLPYNQLAGYISSIYGSPLSSRTATPQLQGNTTLQDIGGLLSTVSAIPGAVRGVQSGINFLGNLF